MSPDQHKDLLTFAEELGFFADMNGVQTPSLDLLIKRISESPLLLRKIPHELQTDALIEAALRTASKALHFADPKRVNQALIARVARVNHYIVGAVSRDLLSEQALVAAASYDSTFFWSLPTELLTEAVHAALIRTGKDWFHRVDKDEQTPAIVQALVESGSSIGYVARMVRSDLLTDEVLSRALENNGALMRAPAAIMIRAFRHSCATGRRKTSPDGHPDISRILKKTLANSNLLIAEALTQLEDLGPDVVAPYAKEDWQMDVFKELFGTSKALPTASPSKRREWLEEDLGL